MKYTIHASHEGRISIHMTGFNYENTNPSPVARFTSIEIDEIKEFHRDIGRMIALAEEAKKGRLHNV